MGENKMQIDLNEIMLRFFRGDLFEPFEGKAFDLIMANPPYLTGEEIRTLQPELAFEPALAMYGGEDGLEIYRRIARSYSDHLRGGGTLMMEIGCDQGAAIGGLFPGCSIVRDLNGRDRFCIVEKDA